jgi:hypothetical protein
MLSNKSNIIKYSEDNINDISLFKPKDFLTEIKSAAQIQRWIL